MNAIQTGPYDLVYGTYALKKHSQWRNAGSALVNTFYRFVFKNSITILILPQQFVGRCSAESIFFLYDLNFTFVDGLLAWNTQRIGQIEVEHHPRAAGRSGYDAKKLIVPRAQPLYKFLAVAAPDCLVVWPGAFRLWILAGSFLSHPDPSRSDYRARIRVNHYRDPRCWRDATAGSRYDPASISDGFISTSIASRNIP